MIFSSLLNAQEFYHVPESESVSFLSGTVDNPFFVPPKTNHFAKKQGSVFRAIYETGVTWDPDVVAAIEYALDLWEYSITSAVEIDIYFERGLIALGPQYFTSSRPVEFVANWPGLNGAQSDLNYTIAIANKFAGEDLLPNNVGQPVNHADCIVRITNSDGFWNTGLDGNPGQGQYDLVTFIYRSVAGGLGFYSGVNNTSGQIEYQKSGYPNSFNRYISDAFGNLMSDYESPSVELDAFITEPDMHYSGCGNVQLHNQRFSFENGISFNFLRGLVYNGTNESALVLEINPQEAFHSIGPDGLCVMEDVGWDEIIITGVEDEIEVKSQDYLNNFINPHSTLSVGNNYEYFQLFYDNAPYGDAINTSTINNKLELYHQTGRYTLESSTNSSWTWNISNPPSGYDWIRTHDGNILGQIVSEAYDYAGVLHKDDFKVEILSVPDEPSLELTTKLCDDSIRLVYYSKGATSYKIEWMEEYGSTHTLNVPSSRTSLVINNNKSKKFFFDVKGINSNGNSISATKVKQACPLQLTLNPNPAFNFINVGVTDQDVVANSVRVFNLFNFNQQRIVAGDGYSNTLYVSLVGLPNGIYVAEYVALDGRNKAETFLNW